jgi:O-antigen biosynthesis protein
VWQIIKSLRPLYLKQKFILLWFFLTDARYRLVNRSEIFDNSYYLRMNPDLTKWNRIPLVHYFSKGWQEGRNPHPLFDTSYYLKQNLDVAEAGVNPLVHYIGVGAREGRDPHPLFDSMYYREQNPDVLEAGITPLEHYLTTGFKEGRNPHPLFATSYYLEQNPDVAEAGVNSLVHYIEIGAREGRNPHPLFDAMYYREQCSDVAEAGITPLEHYLADAAKQGTNPHPLFAISYYLEQNPDVAEAGVNPLVHYLQKGWHEGRKPHPLFDPLFYLKKYPEIAESSTEPLSHYLTEGWHKGYVPSVHFLPDYYLRQTPNITEAIGNPLLHYLHHGHHDNRKPSPYFDPAYYRRIYPDVARSGMHPHYHYLTVGVREERRPSPFFDVAWYLDRTPKLRTLSVAPVEHYIKCGAVEGKSLLPLFDPVYYREHNSDAQDVDDPFFHYLTVGLVEDRCPSKWFDPKFYQNAYPEIAGTGLSPLEHYLQKGIHEQRYPDARVQNLSQKPLISILVPVYNVKGHYLNNCIRSVLYQAYPHWELCLADDCSTQPHVRPVLEKWARRDKRIKVTFLETNHGISGATNAAASIATGEYIAFLDNDDELTVDCLYQVIKVIVETRADLLYTDEDLIGDEGNRFSVFYKPGFNRELLLSHNYITHLVVTTKALFDAVGRFEPEYDGAQDYDLVLKLSERVQRIIHIPHILYHWRASETSSSIHHGKKAYADEAGKNVLIAAMNRRGIQADVRPADWKFYYCVQRKLRIRPFVSILVHWNRDPASAVDWLRFLLASTAYDQFEILFMMSATADKEGAYSQAVTALGDNIFCLHVKDNENQAALYNLAAWQSQGEYLVFLDCGVTIRSADWLESLLAQAQEKGTGAVGCGVNNMQGKSEEIETFPDINNNSSWYYFNFVQKCSIHMNGLQWSQNVLAVPWELCTVSKELFEECNGFDDKDLSSLFWSIDFCLRLRENGYENVYVPFEIAERTQKKTMADTSEEKRWDKERRLFQERWRKRLLEGDVYYNLGVLDNKQIPVHDFLKWYAGVS